MDWRYQSDIIGVVLKSFQERLLPCPLCAAAPTRDSFVRMACSSERCPISRCWMTHEEWQRRPLEDDLAERLESSKKTVVTLTEAVREVAQRERDLENDLKLSREKYARREREWLEEKRAAIARWKERRDLERQARGARAG